MIWGQNYLKESEKNDEKRPTSSTFNSNTSVNIEKKKHFPRSYVCRFFALAEDHDDIKPMQ